MPSPQIQFRAIDALAGALTERAAPGATALGDTARRDLERYYALLDDARPTFGLAEASLLLDALNGTLWEPPTIPLLWAEIDDAIRLDLLDQKWAVDGAALVRRLRDDLASAEQWAVVDAIERAWLLLSQPGDVTPEAALRRVGLVR